METITLEFKFNNLQNALDKFINDFIFNYKTILTRDNKKASGNLMNSIKPVKIEFTSKQITGYISLADYWKYIEYGRKPGGKFPPFDKILNWIKIKPILPRPINGIKPTEKQLAFLVSRKISRDGIKAGNQYKEAIELTWQQNKDNISNAISIDLNDVIDLIKL